MQIQWFINLLITYQLYCVQQHQVCCSFHNVTSVVVGKNIADINVKKRIHKQMYFHLKFDSCKKKSDKKLYSNVIEQFFMQQSAYIAIHWKA